MAGSTARTLRVSLWGTRGSIPSPGPSTSRAGGNTSCVTVDTGGPELLVFDAGSGIRRLGHALGAAPDVDVQLFLTHFHWDHIQGFPFFGPLFRPEARLAVHGPGKGDAEVRGRLRTQSADPFSPVPLEAMTARLAFRALGHGPWTSGGVEVSWMPVRHPGGAVAYRVDVEGRRVVYAPDVELSGEQYDLGARWPDEFASFASGADLLLLDAMFTADELETRRGWGHSSMEEAVRFGGRAGVDRLVLFHHAPDRSDDDIARLEEELGELAKAEDPAPGSIEFAMEGRTFELTNDAR